MNTTTLLLPVFVLFATALSGCMSPPPQPPVPQPALQPAADPYGAPPYGAPPPHVIPAQTPTPALGVSGLTERKPDLCGATKNYASQVGQSGSVIPTLGVTKDYRVVEYRGIEPQDYDPNRIVFRLDQAGIITSVDCG